MATQTLNSSSLGSSHGNLSPIRPHPSEGGEMRPGSPAPRHPSAPREDDPARRRARGDEGHRERPPSAIACPRLPAPCSRRCGPAAGGGAGRGLAGSPAATYLTRRSPPTLAPSVAKLAKAVGASEPATRRREVGSGGDASPRPSLAPRRLGRNFL